MHLQSAHNIFGLERNFLEGEHNFVGWESNFVEWERNFFKWGAQLPKSLQKKENIRPFRSCLIDFGESCQGISARLQASVMYLRKSVMYDVKFIKGWDSEAC